MAKDLNGQTVRADEKLILCWYTIRYSEGGQVRLGGHRVK